MGNRIAITREAKPELAEALQWHESLEIGLGARVFVIRLGLLQLDTTASRYFPRSEGLSVHFDTENLGQILRVTTSTKTSTVGDALHSAETPYETHMAGLQDIAGNRAKMRHGTGLLRLH